jgi:hypothetical protein
MSNAAALTVTELEARAAAIDSALALVRVEIERNSALAAVFFYNAQGRHQLKRLRSMLEMAMVDLTDAQLEMIVTKLERMPADVVPVLETAERQAQAMRLLERQCLAYVRGTVTQVEELTDRLRVEAARPDRHVLVVVPPTLTSAMQHRAMMANSLLRPITRDPAEAHPDPDYGF